MDSVNAILEEAVEVLYGFSGLQILGSVVVGVGLYLAIKLWNGQLKWPFRRGDSSQKSEGFFEETWHELIGSLKPSELAISRNNHNMRLLAVQVSSFRTRHLSVTGEVADEEESDGEEEENEEDDDDDDGAEEVEGEQDQKKKKQNKNIKRLDTGVWFASLERLVEAVPYSSPHRSVPLIGDILLTVLMPNEDLLIAYLLNLVSPTLVLLYEQESTSSAEQSLICRELTRWLVGLSDTADHGNSTTATTTTTTSNNNTAYPKALLWFLLEFDFFGKLVEELAGLRIPAAMLATARREHADKLTFFYTATAIADALGPDRDIAWLRYHLLGLFEQREALFGLLMRREDFEELQRMQRPSREELGEPLIPIPLEMIQ